MDGFRFRSIMIIALALGLGMPQVGWSQQREQTIWWEEGQPAPGVAKTAGKAAPSGEMVCKIYSLADYAENGDLCRWIVAKIPEVILPGTWSDATPGVANGTIRFNDKLFFMVVRHSPQAHAELDAFMQNLRKTVSTKEIKEQREKLNSPPETGQYSDPAWPEKVVARENTPKAETLVALAKMRLDQADDPEVSNEMQTKLRENARELFQKALKIDAKYVPAHRGLAQVYLKLKEFDRAVETMRVALKLNPKNGSLWADLATCHLHRKDYEQAVRCLDAAIELEPENRQFNQMLGLTLARAGRIEQSLAVLSKIYGRDNAHFTVARMMYQMHQEDACKVQLLQALAANPNHSDAQQMLAMVEQNGNADTVPVPAVPVIAGLAKGATVKDPKVTQAGYSTAKGIDADVANKASTYLIPPTVQQPKHLFHMILRFEGSGMDTAVGDLVKNLTRDGTAATEQAKSETAKVEPFNQLFHFIIRYEGDGLIDASVVEFMKYLPKPPGEEKSESPPPAKKTDPLTGPTSSAVPCPSCAPVFGSPSSLPAFAPPSGPAFGPTPSTKSSVPFGPAVGVDPFDPSASQKKLQTAPQQAAGRDASLSAAIQNLLDVIQRMRMMSEQEDSLDPEDR